MSVKKTTLLLWLLIFPFVMSAQKYLETTAQEIKQTWSGHEFSSIKTLLENTASVSELSFMTSILKQPATSDFYKNTEMLTVFLIADKAFDDANEKMRDSIATNPKLTNDLVRYLSVPGRIDENGLKLATEKNGGKATLRTLGKEPLHIEEKNGDLYVVDAAGRRAKVSAYNFFHQKGIFHILDGVVLPED